MAERQTDPTQLPVQLNTRVPFYLREALVEASKTRRVPQTEILRDALVRELTQEIRTQAREEGAYS